MPGETFNKMTTKPSRSQAGAWERDGGVWLLLMAAILAMVAVHARPLLYPWLFDDDFALLTASWDWPTTRQNLWLPFDDNVWPLERLTSYAVVRLAGRVTALPRTTSLQGPIALALAAWYSAS